MAVVILGNPRDNTHSIWHERKEIKGIRVPTLMMPGNNDIHPRQMAEQVHRLIPNAHWAEVWPHAEEPEKYVHRVLQFLSEVEAKA